MKRTHLIWPTIGWGYLPNANDVFDIFRTIQKDIAPRSILEIGFHAGHSTTYMLELMPQASISTVGASNVKIV
jgi:predicted O-methyltransferase YrrM